MSMDDYPTMMSDDELERELKQLEQQQKQRQKQRQQLQQKQRQRQQRAAAMDVALFAIFASNGCSPAATAT